MTHRGRPKTFDRETALDAAMLLFWERGFEQTCVDDLAAAMGIRTSSLYATFGDKETLFLQAIEHYRTGRGSIYDAAVVAGKTAKEEDEQVNGHQRNPHHKQSKSHDIMAGHRYKHAGQNNTRDSEEKPFHRQ